MNLAALGGVAAVVAVAAGAAWVRLAPSDPSVWHVDPDTVTARGAHNSYLVAEHGDVPPLLLTLPPEAAAARLDAVALATPRTQVLAGQGGFVTFVTRSALWGFPDYTSVRVLPAPGGSAVTVFARSRFGKGDGGVNRARVEAWLAGLAMGA